MSFNVVEHKAPIKFTSQLSLGQYKSKVDALTENGQQVPMISAITDITGGEGEIELLTLLVRCSDYFNDFIHSQHTGDEVSKYGYTAKPDYQYLLERETVCHTYVVDERVESEGKEELIRRLGQLSDKIEAHTGTGITVHFHGAEEIGEELQGYAVPWQVEDWSPYVYVITVEYPVEVMANTVIYHLCTRIVRGIFGHILQGHDQEVEGLEELLTLSSVLGTGVDIFSFAFDGGNELLYRRGECPNTIHNFGGCMTAVTQLKKALYFSAGSAKIGKMSLGREDLEKYRCEIHDEGMLAAVKELEEAA